MSTSYDSENMDEEKGELRDVWESNLLSLVIGWNVKRR